MLLLQMSIETWVNDELHTLVGMSDRNTANFIISLARKAMDTTDLVQKLADSGAIDVIDAFCACNINLFSGKHQSRAFRLPIDVTDSSLCSESREAARTFGR